MVVFTYYIGSCTIPNPPSATRLRDGGFGLYILTSAHPAADRPKAHNFTLTAPILTFVNSRYISATPHRLLAVTSYPGEAQEAAKNDLIGCLELLEGELGDKPYFGGDTFGFVDVALIPFFNFFCTIEQLSNFRIVAECPKLVAWRHRCMEKESVSKSFPNHHKLYDFLLGSKKKLEAK
ncbi:hypothetical protein TEA_005381 [Camellia sinensis var. sinensis]|uniref:GST C-terminal domain-containing protein n=1 Tax=Camellia sinensis var. sinensis TaxID=542762 RepID=A0A4S4DLM0_CAMSN|nr:hypothetical protein TEA_005381 [Camellia sinensis var. sinensis]